MAEICGILSLKLNVVCQLEEHLKSVTCDFMDTLSEKGYSVNCALRSVDQGNGLLSVYLLAGKDMQNFVVDQADKTSEPKKQDL